MREAQKMRRAGADFTNAYVIDSLCCPSRAATLTGLPPHLNGVRTNTGGGPVGPQGGFRAFLRARQRAADREPVVAPSPGTAPASSGSS